MPKFDVVTTTATQLEGWQNDGTLTSEDIVTEYWNQIQRHNGYLHAVISTPPLELLLERARYLDDQRSQGNVLSSLHGIPILVKDNTATHPDLGMETTAGTYALAGSKVPDSAPFIKQLISAGVIILAKANLSELSNFRGLHMPTGWSAVGGLTQSPYVIGGKRWDDGFGGHSATGGSSSGSCAGVAAGFAPVALGTDTNGSILMPATRHDVYALKPTIGLVSQEGICPISLDFDSAGPIARSSRDVALLMDAMVDRSKVKGIPESGYTSYQTKSFDGIRIGVLNPKDWHLPPAVAVPNAEADQQRDDEILQAYEELRSLTEAVKQVEILSPDALMVDGMSQIQRVMDSQFKTTLESHLQSLEVSKVRNLDELMDFMKANSDLELPSMSPNLKRLEIAAEFKSTPEEYQEALDDMRDFGRRRSVDKCLADYDVDVILGPADSRMHEFYAAAGYPMANLPLGYLNFNGRPFGLCAIATANNEGLLLQLMSAWEENFNRDRKPPTWIGGNPDVKSEL